MHTLKDIRNNISFYKKKFGERNTDINIEELIDLDKENRDLIQKKEKLEQEKKLLSKTKDPNNFDKSGNQISFPAALPGFAQKTHGNERYDSVNGFYPPQPVPGRHHRRLRSRDLCADDRFEKSSSPDSARHCCWESPQSGLQAG